MGGAAVSLARAQRRPKPNFLFILADDHAGYALGCDGNPLARTPNLDRFASGAVRFAAHHCNSPVCTPSRQSFLTGQLPHAAGVTVLSTPLAPDKPTLAKQFQKAGYRTAVFGKMHFNRPAEPGLHGFDLVMTGGRDHESVDDQRKAPPVPRRYSYQTRPVAPVSRPGPHLAERRQTASRAIRRGSPRHLHRKSGHSVSGGKSRKALRALDQLSGTSFALRFSGRGPRTL